MILEIKNIKKSFMVQSGVFSKAKKEVIKDVSFSIEKGECLGIIGESGSGKSTLAKLILGLEKQDSGEIELFGSKKRKEFAKKISVVFQDYSSSANPRFKVVDIIKEPLRHSKLKSKELKQEIIKLLEKVGLSEEFLYRFPHQLSGGQLQRVCIARAIATKPQFIVLDEAVSSLDISVQVQVLDLLKELKKSENLSYLFITHDLLSVTYICDKVIFFKDGQILEYIEDINKLKDVQNEYSRALLNVYNS